MVLNEAKKDIRRLKPAELERFFEDIGEKKFRAKQVDEWIWKKSVQDFDEMTNISLKTREELQKHFVINRLSVDKMQRSSDGTIKNAVRLHDGLFVESVLIPTATRITACISSQVGCSLDCTFCATARLKRMRNLTPEEIYDQVVTIKKQGDLYFERPLTNIVFMGMGEPLLNYTHVKEAIHRITTDKGLGMAPKRITLSTVGIPKLIKKMADEEVKFNLAVSLHSAIDEVRSKIMPINQVSPIKDLMESLLHWYDKTKRKITFEYVIWKGINDTKKDAEALAKLCRSVPSKVNIIQYNPIDDDRFINASQETLAMYQEILTKNRIVVKVRESRGQDIDAACGQLANKNTN